MDTSIHRIEASPCATPARRTLSLSARPVKTVFVTGAAHAVPFDLGPRRFTAVDASSANGASLCKAILDCAIQATAAEPLDTDRRLLSFIAKLSGKMEYLGERELDAVLWQLAETKPLPTIGG